MDETPFLAKVKYLLPGMGLGLYSLVKWSVGCGGGGYDVGIYVTN